MGSSKEPIADLEPKLRFDPRNRRLLGGRLECRMADGSERPLEIRVLGDTGVQLGAGLYFGLDGRHHGECDRPLHRRRPPPPPDRPPPPLDRLPPERLLCPRALAERSALPLE